MIRIPIHMPAALLRICRVAALAVSLATWTVPAMAQGDAMFTQFWAVPTYYNPAESGSIDFVRIRGGAKLQWVGVHNAPQSFVGAADMPVKLGKKHRLGVGALFNQESVGLYSNMLAGVQLSYRLNWLKGVWSFGVQPAYYDTKFKGSDVYIPEGDDFHQPDDPELPGSDVSGNAFDFSAGISYTHKYFTLGLSVLHVLEPTVTMDGDKGGGDSEGVEFQTTLPRMAYFTAVGNIPLKNTLFSLQPSLLVGTDFSRFTASAAMRATYNRFISFGLGYRYKEAFSATIAAEFKNFFIGYAYDYPLSALGKASSGSHEVVIGYNVKLNFGEKNKNKHRSIRIM